MVSKHVSGSENSADSGVALLTRYLCVMSHRNHYSMAPRFAEVSRPVEAGVEWAAQLPSTLTHRIYRVILNNATEIVFEKLENLAGLVPEVRVLWDLQGALSGCLQHVPPASHNAKNLATAAFAVLLLRTFVVFVKTRSILSNYGAAKAICKEC